MAAATRYRVEILRPFLDPEVVTAEDVNVLTSGALQLVEVATDGSKRIRTIASVHWVEAITTAAT